MELGAIQTINDGIEITCEIDDILTYAVFHNGETIVRDVCIKNTTESDIDNLSLKVDSTNSAIDLFELGIDKIKPGEEIHFKRLRINVNASYLSGLTEKVICYLKVSVCKGDTTLASCTKELTVLAYDQWPGLLYTPELLAAFSMPNHPVVAGLILNASNYLEKWTGNPSLAGYQFNDPNRVKAMAAAAYAAIQQKNITYAEPPSSFEEFGQRIRLADTVLEQHLGTCMDMTLLYVACLEAMGLNPIMIMMKGHIFAGVWLVDQSFSEMLMDDPSQIEKRMSKGIRELLVVECTAMCAGKSKDFEEAIVLGEANVSNYEKFGFVIDVSRARSMGIIPLPVRMKTETGFEVVHEERKEKDITGAPVDISDVIDLSLSGQKDVVTKQTQWERKLLDMSLRNMLINLRMTKAVVPLLSNDISILEDALSDGEEFLVLPRPKEMGFNGDGTLPVEALSDLGPYTDFVELESKHKKLHSIYTDSELNACLTKMYRSAKTSLEENGASTLYLALGLLRWIEGTKESATIRYAPIVLVPIDILRKSANKGYALKMRDEDAQINITLLEFLKQNYDLRIQGLNPPPVDNHGLDLPKIFAIVRHAVMNLSMWDVVEVGCISNFSFSQFVMWNDIHSRSDFLMNNKIVRSLINGVVDWDSTIPEGLDTDEAYLPVTVDSSQLKAINMAAGGVSFVLHGPPGTGKSQTITAMIANALTKGKTVLFVAEKMAALEVVQKRLASLGIEDYCLELHSNKATKKAVLDQLRKGLEKDCQGTSTDYDKKIQDIRAMRANLDAYAKALHVMRPFGKSLRQLMDIYETVPDLGIDVRFDRNYAGMLSESDLDHQIHSLERLVAAGRAIGHPCNHPLLSVNQTEYSQKLKFDLDAIVKEYKTALEQLDSGALSFTTLMNLSKPVSDEDWLNGLNYAKSVIASEDIPAFLRNTDNVDREFAVPKNFLAIKEEFDKKKSFFEGMWNTYFLKMDMESFRARYMQASSKFFGKGKALAAITSELQAYAGFQIVTDNIPVYLNDVGFFQKEVREFETLEKEVPYDWKVLIENYPNVEAMELYQASVKDQLKVIAKFSAQIKELELSGKLDECIDAARKFVADYNIALDKQKVADELLMLDFSNSTQNWIKYRVDMCNCIIENASNIKDWVIYRQFSKECRELGLSPICDAYENGMPHDAMVDVYLKSIYRAIILSVIEKEPILNSFTGTGFNERIVQFKKLDEEFMELTKSEMFYKLTHQLPSTNDSVQISKELNILRRAISSNGRGLSIRSLFEQIPTILPKLCPCMLMSPISVAQYLAAENELFDIVVFDEASQLPTCKAVGVLARGKDAVIVGDPNQMPPTSFFAGNTVDEDNLDIEDLDSILDDCLALGMPSSHLHWHYRSRHESLIAFSNREFYENSMLTFPSVNDREKKVSMIKVDGFFERGKARVNRGEAKAIVDEIKRRFNDPVLRNLTIGVVTFNINQQTLIEDMLLSEFQKNSEFDRWANTGDETMFVKNLENVQGDERDVILFSIAYGPDEEGKVSHNFGPINKEGGWKRLNVAVSRARQEMIVFSTMSSDKIELRRTKSKGVEALKNFLEFAEKGRLQGEYTDTRVQKEQGILEHICKSIADAGYKYQKSVGHSKFKVDIAVLNPYNEEEYLVGIMLDGDSYRQSTNTKDREVAQIKVLQGLGWKLHRIWTLDWWDNKNKELSKLMSVIEEQKKNAFVKYQEYLDKQKNNESVQKTVEDSEISIAESVENAETPAIVIDEKYEVTEKEELNPETSFAELKAAEKIMQTEKTVTNDKSEDTVKSDNDNASINKTIDYEVAAFISADVEITPLATVEFIKKENMAVVGEKIQQIIDAEAPIEYDRLAKKTLRAFGILRSTPQALDAFDNAFKKTSCKQNRQSGIRFIWRKDQDQDAFRLFRVDAKSDDKRALDEIGQQELKNAVCYTLMQKGAMEKDILIRETIRTMGFSRSSEGLIEAVERGIKYGRKTGEIILNSEKNLELA